MNTLIDKSDQLIPAGAELARETPEMPPVLGELACVDSLAGSSDADGTGTTASIDPDTMDPRAFPDAAGGFIIPTDVLSLQ